MRDSPSVASAYWSHSTLPSPRSAGVTCSSRGRTCPSSPAPLPPIRSAAAAPAPATSTSAAAAATIFVRILRREVMAASTQVRRRTRVGSHGAHVPQSTTGAGSVSLRSSSIRLQTVGAAGAATPRTAADVRERPLRRRGSGARVTADVGSAAAFHVARSETYYFDGWRFDEHDGRIVRDDTEVSLRPKTAGVLRALLARAGEVVAKPELLEEVWGSAATGDDVLAVCVNELRRLLGDDSHRPRYIATAHRRGYRFIAPVSQSPAHPRGPVRLLVGRERELAILRNWWETACGDRRVVGFVTGAPGIGRTALVRAFATEVRIA